MDQAKKTLIGLLEGHSLDTRADVEFVVDRLLGNNVFVAGVSEVKPDKVIKALEYCANHVCAGCPEFMEGHINACQSHLLKKAHDLLIQLIGENEVLKKQTSR